LVYTPLNLTVVSDGERNTILKGIYEDLSQGVGQGIDLFYKRIRDKYLNIRRSDVGTFLKSQKVYQIIRPQNHIVNKPILAVSPNERWGMDCLNMVAYAGANGGIDAGYKFILTVVDYFSRKVFLRPLKAQTAINVRNAMVNIVAETKTYPRIIQADNGSEFKKETSEWIKDNNITYIKTLSYSPESNGLTELKNKLVRNILREIMIRTNSRNWTTHLQTTANLLRIVR
jgi:transposase InsO family protein